MMRLACLLLAGLVTACSPQPSAEASPTQSTASERVAAMPQRHPESGLAVIPLAITTASGTHRFRAEVAATLAEQQKGMMFRTAMAPDEAMIFPNTVPQVRSFWMKNTFIPLDIIYVGPDRRVLNIVTGEPYSLESLPSTGPVINVVEIAGGRAAQLGIKPGDTVQW
jgi:uncharacterized protein